MISQKQTRRVQLETLAPPAYSPRRSTAQQLNLSDNALPGYSSGTEVTPVSFYTQPSISTAPTLGANSNNNGTGNSNHQPIVSVRVDQPHRVHDIDDIITGRIYFTPKHDCVLGSVTATLAGSESTRKPHHWVSQRVLQRKMKLAQYTVSPAAFPTGSIARKGFTYSFTFSVQVPLTYGSGCGCGTCGDNDKDNLPCLVPPSLGSAHQLLDGAVNSVVCYFINATVTTLRVGEDQQAATDSVHACEQPPVVTIIPSYPNMPRTPSYTEALTTTKTGKPSHATTELRRGLIKTLQVGRLDLAPVANTPLLVLSRDASDVSFLRVQATFTPSCVSNLCERPPKISSVVAKLAALTQSADPDSELAETDPCNHTVTTVEQHPLLQYAPSSASPSWVAHGSHYTCTLKIPLALPVSSTTATVPSFQGRFVGRRYEVRVSLGLAGFQPVCLSVPATVTASFVGKAWYGVPALTGEDVPATTVEPAQVPIKA